MIPAVIVGLVAWSYAIYVLWRAKLTFFKFLVGSVGMFVLLMLLLQPILTAPLSKAVAAVTGLIGEWTGAFYSYYQYSLVFIRHGADSISLYVDYECSGIIEIFAFSSLLWFFPLYSIVEKLVVNIIGIIWIFLSNIIRMTSICLLVYFFGNDIFFFAHAIFGRIIFYTLSIILFFYVFTRAQIMKQRVGKFRYGDATA
ncbi:MAG: exosortase family protein XrtG [Oscillospiraceae bacterium]|jgi:exosortase family protein XrtG|nr:exosortase family protein XrtG [Clostridiales bacterium]MDD4095246.1 exosortase family protein XrtG [Oscillospiraceae bacterium]